MSSDDLLKLLLEHPATARRLAWRLCETFLGEVELSDAELSSLAEGLRANQLNVSWGVETVLRSKRFFSDKAIGRRVPGPTEWTVGVLSALELQDPPPSTLLVSEWMTRMGQDLFFPPNVGGWNEGRSWLGSRALISRTKFSLALVVGETWSPARPLNLWKLVERHQPTESLAEAVRWFSRLLWGTVDDRVINEILLASKGGTPEESLATAVGMLLAQPENQLA